MGTSRGCRPCRRREPEQHLLAVAFDAGDGEPDELAHRTPQWANVSTTATSRADQAERTLDGGGAAAASSRSASSSRNASTCPNDVCLTVSSGASHGFVARWSRRDIVMAATAQYPTRLAAAPSHRPSPRRLDRSSSYHHELNGVVASDEVAGHLVKLLSACIGCQPAFSIRRPEEVHACMPPSSSTTFVYPSSVSVAAAAVDMRPVRQ